MLSGLVRRSTGFAVVALVAMLAAPGTAHAQFTDIGAGLTGVNQSSVAWGDYDNDGDLDILLTGGDIDHNLVSTLYRKNGDGTFTDIGAGLTAVWLSSVAWGDYDNDGDLDILLTGRDAIDNRVSKVYENNGDATFTDIGAGLTGVSSSSVNWGDYDNDGDLDILLTGGGAGGNPVSEVYRNNGDGTFTDVGAGLTAVSGGSVAWGDYDNDGDLDILLTGTNAAFNYVSNVYRNDGGGTFTDIGAGLTGVSGGGVAWGDYDNDGDLDILLTGYDAGFSPVSKVYGNNGDGTFTDINAALTGVYFSSVAWGDYDNDGDLDILLTGSEPPNYRVSKVYQNNGDGTFTDTGVGLFGVDSGSVAWGDYDNDGDLDILLTGENDGGNFVVSKVYRNDLPPVIANTFTDIGAGLTGATQGSAAWGDYDNDGDLDILLTGLVVGTNRVSTVYRNNGDGTFTDINAGLTGVRQGSVAWGDYDNDGDQDILLTGYDDSSGGAVSKVYGNNGDGTFTDIAAGLTGVLSSSVAWGDYDNDGDLDILLTGATLTGGPGSSRVSKLYGNNGDGTFTDINAGLTEVVGGSVAWGDYDNDGDLDILLTGNNSSISGPSKISKVYGNNGDGTFTDINSGLTGVDHSSVAWGDYDNDGDLDILLTGYASSSFVSKVYGNNGNGTFTDINAGLTGVYFSSVSWGDYDNDGDLDILLTGDIFDTGVSDSDLVSKIYRNNGDGTFTDIAAGLTRVLGGTVAWGDYDNDGDLDILLTGYHYNSGSVSEVYRNDRDPPVIVCPADITQEPTAPTGNVVTYSPTATDVYGETVPVVCNPPSGSTFAVGSTTVVTCTATDDSGHTAQCSFTVRILSVEDTLDSLLDEVAELEAAGIIKHGTAQAFTSALENAKRSFERGNINAACSQLDDFINLVQGQIDSGKLSMEDGQPLIDSANNLRAALGC